MEIRLFFPIVILFQGHDYLLAYIQEWMNRCTDENVVHKNILYIKDRPISGGQNEDLLLIKQQKYEWIVLKRNTLKII